MRLYEYVGPEYGRQQFELQADGMIDVVPADYEIAVELSGEVGAVAAGRLSIHDPKTPCDIAVEPGVYVMIQVETSEGDKR